MNYLDNINLELKEYFNILCKKDFPMFILKYLNEPEFIRLSKIGQFCGCDYTKIYNIRFWYSRLDHSVATALMAWNFTKDKKQTILALFHDLGTPAFSHCIDYLLGDAINQTSSEIKISEIVNKNEKLLEFLKEDEIEISEIDSLEKYPIVEMKNLSYVQID